LDVSIVIIAHNYAAYLNECINSCLIQSASNLKFEIIVVDDGSTDNTQEVLSRFDDIRLRKFLIKNSGIERASNFGILNAIGRYIVRVDADDKLLIGYLSSMKSFIDLGFDFIYPDYFLIDSSGSLLEQIKLPEFSREEVMQRGDFLATGTLISSSLLKKMGGYSIETINSGLENYELILKLLESGAKGMHVPSPLFCYRRHEKNFSELKKNQIINNGRKLFSKMNLGDFRTNDNHPYKLKVYK